MPDDTYRPQSPDLSDFPTNSSSHITTTTSTFAQSNPLNFNPDQYSHNTQGLTGYQIASQEEYRPRSPVLPPSFDQTPFTSITSSQTYRNSIPDYSRTYNYPNPHHRTQSQPYIPPIPSLDTAHSSFSNYQPPLPLHSHSQTFTGNTVQSPLQEQPTYAFPPHVKSEDSNPSILEFPSSSTTHSPQSNMARTTGRVQTRPKYEEPDDYTPEMYPEDAPIPVAGEVKMEPNGALNLGAGPSRGIEVRTKFPVARIKRIMQADEEVGKVAQVTPVAVSKALELFMISLVSRSADLAKSKNSKRVTAQHLKAIVDGDEQFDFLNEVVAKVAEGVDAGGSKRKPVAASESEDEGEGKKKKRGGGRKKKEESA